jgi:hypothetical protein
VISNLTVVDADFIREFVTAHEMLFEADPEEYDTFKEQSASMRRVFTRRNRVIPLIGRRGGFFKVLPRGGKIVAADPAKFRKHGPYKSDHAYARAVKEAQAQNTAVEFEPELSI